MNIFSASWRLIACLLTTLILVGCLAGDQPQRSQRHAQGGVHQASLSQDGRYALVASVNHNAGLWDLQTNGLLYSLKNSQQNPHGIIATAFSPDNNYVLTAERRNIVLWDRKKGTSLAFWATEADILSIALGPDGNVALIGMKNGTAKLINAKSGALIGLLEHSEKINSVALSADQHYALTGSDDKKAKLWDIKNGKLLHTWLHDKKITQVLISPKSNYALTTASQEKLKLWRIKDGELLHQLGHRPITVTSAKFSPSEKFLVVGALPRLLQLWDVANGNKIKTWRLPKDRFWKPTSTIIYAVTFSKDEKQVITEDSNGFGYFWEITS